jgi:glycosyltransferase involved in cell wall biosynthesis
MDQKSKGINLIYSVPKQGHSGQSMASDFIKKGLQENEWLVNTVYIPSLDRVNPSEFLLVSFFKKLVLSIRIVFFWIYCSLRIHNQYPVHLNISLTKYGMIRDSMPLMLKKMLTGSLNKLIISIHNSSFMAWEKDSFESRFFKRIVDNASYVTVLGDNHRKKLLDMGIEESKVVIMTNTCLLNPVSDDFVVRKHQATSKGGNVVNILFLSSLIESKGYIDFINSIHEVKEKIRDNSFFIPQLNFYLCGKLTESHGNSCEFLNLSLAKDWIENQVRVVNDYERISLHWIDGVDGKDKEDCLRSAHIFVLPTKYKSEAQPIVLLEALASGCCIITSRVGEITNTLSEESAIFLDHCSEQEISEAIVNLCLSEKSRTDICLSGLHLFVNNFSFDIHIRNWMKLIEVLLDG